MRCQVLRFTSVLVGHCTVNELKILKVKFEERESREIFKSAESNRTDRQGNESWIKIAGEFS